MEHILSGLSLQQVAAAAALQPVIAGATLEFVLAGSAPQLIGATTADQEVVTAAAIEQPASTDPDAGLEGSVAEFTLVIGGAGGEAAEAQHVLSRFTPETATAIATGEGVIPVAAAHLHGHIPQAAGIESIIAGTQIAHHPSHAAEGLVPAVEFHPHHTTGTVQGHQLAAIAGVEVPARAGAAPDIQRESPVAAQAGQLRLHLRGIGLEVEQVEVEELGFPENLVDFDQPEIQVKTHEYFSV